MITQRDQKIIDYLREYGPTDSQKLHDLFFSDKTKQWSNKRLKTLFDNGVLKRKKVFETNNYIYFVGG